MAVQNEAMPLRTLNRGLTRKQRALMDEIDRRAAGIVARIEASGGFAEIVPSERPRWHIAITVPGNERLAARELSERGFGVYLPESQSTEVRRGRKVERVRLLLSGYVLFFGWCVDRSDQERRVRACEGVADVLLFGERVAAVPDRVIDRLRAIENTERPLPSITVEVESKKRKRKSRKTHKQVQVCECDIVGVHAYSPILEELRAGASEEEWLAAFTRLIRRPACEDEPNQSTGRSPA